MPTRTRPHRTRGSGAHGLRSNRSPTTANLKRIVAASLIAPPLAIRKLRSGSYFPHWLLERRRRAEQALISVVATACLLGVSTRRVEKLAESLGVTQLSKPQISAMAKHPDKQVAAFRNRPLDAGPYAFVRVDALTQKVREGGRIMNVHALIAVGVNADGHREILGMDVAPPARTAQADWPSCARSSPAACPASNWSSPTRIWA